MKNIHMLPTEKPSRVFITKELGLEFDNQMLENTELDCQNQHIYITSDEEIKEGDWCILLENHYVNGGIGKYNTEKAIGYGLHNTEFFKKIILTTDQDLIKDGVQAIDDNFLEWFVKNSSCEWVRVNDLYNYTNESTQHIGYKIIIPKEEPKQETLKEAAYNEFPNQEFYSSDEWTRAQRTCGREGFIRGAKWQQERMYSEEEVKHLMTLAFEQGFKKADVVEAGLEAKETDTEVNWIFLKHKK